MFGRSSVSVTITAFVVLVGATPSVSSVGRASEMSFLDNGSVRVGVDLRNGGAIGYVAASDGGDDLVNIHDLGRYVQQSYYMAPAGFGSPAPPWENFPYNPIGAGDAFGNPASVLSLSNDGKTIYVKTAPLLWPLNGVHCECVFEQWITLDGPAVKVHNRITNARTDKVNVGYFNQELPAVYTVGRLDRLVTYDGPAPHTGAPIDTIAVSGCTGDGSKSFVASEGWEAFVDSTGSGLGVMNPDVDEFTGAFCPPIPSDPGVGTTSWATGYMAPVDRLTFLWNTVYTYDYRLIVGSIGAIRKYAVAHETHIRTASLTRRTPRSTSGILTAPDQFTKCTAWQAVELQQLQSRRWKRIAGKTTNAQARFTFPLPRGPTTVRVAASPVTVHAHLCPAVVSPRLTVSR